ncbi:MAG TPA: 1-acyl-sn-glycerol-3-phosphate acyltransferase [candidate division Zixibacteria bacterium]|nr:1-acyl-sn-glycerol-3-phosphate acyltransferase [candidate division Zixibacteria bacterium]HEQ97867.1 1-acyl-sn-glycerol-3-phosphate acyltransferase [candidate division Zixibacteria bacterium]
MKLFYRFSSAAARIYAKIFYGVRVYGQENLNFEGPALLASNHISLFDPPLLGGMIPFEIHFMAKAELFEKPLFGRLISALNAFPVKRGMIDRRALKISGEILARGGRVLVFPEGTRQKSGILAKPRPGAAKLAIDYNVPVLPICLMNTNRLRHMIFSRNHLKICYGELIDTGSFMPDASEKERIYGLSDKIMAEIANLQEFLKTA